MPSSPRSPDTVFSSEPDSSSEDPTYAEIDELVHRPRPSENSIHEYSNIHGLTWNQQLGTETHPDRTPLSDLFKPASPTSLGTARSTDTGASENSNWGMEDDDGSSRSGSGIWEKTKDAQGVRKFFHKRKVSKAISVPCLMPLEVIRMAERANSFSHANLSRYEVNSQLPKDTNRKAVASRETSMPIQDSQEEHMCSDLAIPQSVGTPESSTRAICLPASDMNASSNATENSSRSHSVNRLRLSIDENKSRTFLITRV